MDNTEDHAPQPAAKGTGAFKKWLLGALILLILGITGGIHWLFSTSSGLHWLLATASRATDGALTFSGVTGSLRRTFHAQSIVFRDDKLVALVEDLTFRWQPQHLLTGNLLIEALTVRSVEVHSAPSEEEESAAPPESLRLPINITISKLGLRSLKTYTLGNDTPDIIVTDLALRLDSDGQRHHLQTLALELEWGKIAGNLQIDADPPFDIASRLVFYNWATAVNTDGKPSYFTIRLGGNLEQIKAALAVKDGKLDGKGTLSLQPFAEMPLSAMDLAFTGLNPSIFSPDLPKADLSFHSHLHDTQAGQLTGYLLTNNTIARPLDKDGLPLKEVRMQIAITNDHIQLSDIAIRLSDQDNAAGSLAGNLSWLTGTQSGSADIRVQQLNPAVLESSLRPAKLSGNLQLNGDQNSQQGQITLYDKALRFNMDMALSHTTSAVAIEKLKVAHGDSSLSGHGVLQLDESQPFTFEGLLKQFDVSAFADVPRSDLNASFKLAGQLVPQPDGNIDFAIKQSHFANQPITGQGIVALQQSNHIRSDAHLRLGDNRLEIKGKLGNPSDHLLLALSAPQLAQLGLGLKGDIHSRVTLTGTLDHPGVVFEVDSNHFNFRDEHQLSHLKTRGNLQGTAINLDLQTGDYRMGTETYLQKLSVGLTGTQAHHKLLLKSDIGPTTEVVFQASGSLTTQPGNAQHFQWDGVLEKIALTGSVPLDLVTQPTVRIGPEQAMLGHTRFTVAGGEIDIQQAQWTPKHWSTQGNFTRIALRSGDLSPESFEPLKLGGDWQFTADRQLSGHLRVRQEGGDIVLPLETPFALGLQTLTFNLLAEDNNLNGQLTVRGKHIGETTAQASIPLRSTDTAWEIRKDAPLSGKLQLDIPDLSWIGPVLNDGLHSGGRLAAQAMLAGTFDQPVLQGTVTGDSLTIALLDEGLQLKEGKLAVRFDQDRLQLDTLHFTAPLEKPSKDRLLKNLKLARDSGSLDMYGSLDIHNQHSELTIEIDHLPLTQQTERWIVVSGNSRIGFRDQALDITGKIVADVGFLKPPEGGRPELADDIIISSETEPEPEASDLQVNLDATLDLGERFFLRASGLEGRLAGQLRLRSKPGELLSATGTIATRDTRFEAYGQRLLVRRGIVNFDGPLDNPGLNILAIRTNLPPGSEAELSGVIDQPSQDSGINALAVRSGSRVEAGVEITGTVRRPKIKLVSQPEVPDSEKLSWIVLGRPPDAGGLDSALLLSAAGSILGGTDEGVLDSITQGLGIDDFSIRQQPGGSLTNQIGTVGKRLSSRAYLSYERGLTSASAGIAKLTYSLFPNVSVVTRAGDDSAVDLFYNFHFD